MIRWRLKPYKRVRGGQPQPPDGPATADHEARENPQRPHHLIENECPTIDVRRRTPHGPPAAGWCNNVVPAAQPLAKANPFSPLKCSQAILQCGTRRIAAA